MMLSTPRFWYRKSGSGWALVALLGPPSRLYEAISKRRRLRQVAYDPGVPVVCVGNLTLGGTGKTPVAHAILTRLRAKGLDAHGLSRGYGGRLKVPHRVDLAHDQADAVGDEALMLAGAAPMWIARRRPEGAKAAAAAGAELLVLDDGHQNGALKKSLSLVVVDGETRSGEWPFGAGHVFPLGPLREPLSEGLSRADAVIIMTPADVAAPDEDLLRVLKGPPAFIARLKPTDPPPSGPLMGFAGVAKPWRIDRALRAAGADLVDFAPFPDHHPYDAADLRALRRRAADVGATLITTEKDWVRLAPGDRADVKVFKVSAVFDDPDGFDDLLTAHLRPAG